MRWRIWWSIKQAEVEKNLHKSSICGHYIWWLKEKSHGWEQDMLNRPLPLCPCSFCLSKQVLVNIIFCGVIWQVKEMVNDRYSSMKSLTVDDNFVVCNLHQHHTSL